MHDPEGAVRALLIAFGAVGRGLEDAIRQGMTRHGPAGASLIAWFNPWR